VRGLWTGVAAVERLGLSLSDCKYSEHVQSSNFLSAAVWSRGEFNVHRPTGRDASKPSHCVGSGRVRKWTYKLLTGARVGAIVRVLITISSLSQPQSGVCLHAYLQKRRTQTSTNFLYARHLL